MVVVDYADNFGLTELGATRADTQLVAPVVSFGPVLSMANAFTTEFASRIPALPLTVDVSNAAGASAYGVLTSQFEENNRNIVSLINVSKDNRDVTLIVPAGTPNDIENLIDGQTSAATFTMAPMDVLLLSVGSTVDAPPPPPPPAPPPRTSSGGGSIGWVSLLCLLTSRSSLSM